MTALLVCVDGGRVRNELIRFCWSKNSLTAGFHGFVAADNPPVVRGILILICPGGGGAKVGKYMQHGEKE